MGFAKKSVKRIVLLLNILKYVKNRNGYPFLGGGLEWS
jgi:hypothetical protein